MRQETGTLCFHPVPGRPPGRAEADDGPTTLREIEGGLQTTWAELWHWARLGTGLGCRPGIVSHSLPVSATAARPPALVTMSPMKPRSSVTPCLGLPAAISLCMHSPSLSLSPQYHHSITAPPPPPPSEQVPQRPQQMHGTGVGGSVTAAPRSSL